MGKPVKLMWHRADDARARAGRTRWRPRGSARRTSPAQVLSLRAAPHQRRDRLQPRPRRDAHRHGRPSCPAGLGNLGFAESDLRADPGAALRLRGGHAAAQRDRPAVQHRQHAQHLLARRARGQRAGRRPAGRARWAWTRYEFRLAVPQGRPGAGRCCTRSPRSGSWGRAMPAGTAQGIAIHKEYKGATACLVEIDCRPETVNRKIRDGVTGPRVTKVDHRRRRRPGDQPDAGSRPR